MVLRLCPPQTATCTVRVPGSRLPCAPSTGLGGLAVTALLVVVIADANSHFLYLSINSLPNNNKACQGSGLLPYYAT